MQLKDILTFIKNIFEIFTKGETLMKTLNGIVFLETKDIRKSLNIGNQTCL